MTGLGLFLCNAIITGPPKIRSRILAQRPFRDRYQSTGAAIALIGQSDLPEESDILRSETNTRSPSHLPQLCLAAFPAPSTFGVTDGAHNTLVSRARAGRALSDTRQSRIFL